MSIRACGFESHRRHTGHYSNWQRDCVQTADSQGSNPWWPTQRARGGTGYTAGSNPVAFRGMRVRISPGALNSSPVDRALALRRLDGWFDSTRGDYDGPLVSAVSTPPCHGGSTDSNSVRLAHRPCPWTGTGGFEPLRLSSILSGDLRPTLKWSKPWVVIPGSEGSSPSGRPSGEFV